MMLTQGQVSFDCGGDRPGVSKKWYEMQASKTLWQWQLLLNWKGCQKTAVYSFSKLCGKDLSDLELLVSLPRADAPLG